MMLKKEKIFAFVDSQNLNLSIKNQGWDLDFARFRIYLKDKFKVSKVFLFIGYVAGNEVLYTELQKAGYVLVFKPTLEYKKKEEKLVKGNVDAELVLHSMIEFENYDKAIIVSGDGDFHCLIEYLELKGKLDKLIVPNKFKYSSLLRKFEKYICFLNDLRKKVGKTNKKKKGTTLRTKP